MSFLLYTRCPDFDFSGARLGNSVSQNRRTNGSISTILQTSPIRKKSLSGILGAGISGMGILATKRHKRLKKGKNHLWILCLFVAISLFAALKPSRAA